jgi:photosystem II stability/assembly factor-like uncharacterized protein
MVTPNGDYFVNDTFEIDRSVDQGATWQKVAPASDFSGGAIAYAPSDPSVMIAGSAMGTLKSTDGGSNWFALNGWNGAGGTVKDIVFDAKDENTLYAAVGGSEAGGVFTSTSGGAIWNEKLSSRDVWAIAPDPSNPDILYAGVRADSTNPGGVLKSTDGGKSWKQMWSAKDVLSLLVDPSNTQRIFAGTRDSGIYESTDGGGTWNKKSGSTIVAPVTALAFDPQNGSHLLAATGGAGVVSSTDGGSTWSADNQGLTDLNVAAMDVQAASASDVLAVTYGGKGFWAPFSASNSPTPTPTPTPKPKPVPSPAPVSNPTWRPPRTLAPVTFIPTSTLGAITPLPAPSPTGWPHHTMGHVAVPRHKSHGHPVIVHHRPRPTHYEKISRGANLVGPSDASD